MKEPSQYLFSYGTLQQPSVQLQIFGRTLKGTPDLLQGYRCRTIEIKDKKFLAGGENHFQQTLSFTDDSSDVVKGTIFEVTEAELRKADSYEPENYHRRQLQFESGKEAWVYLADEEKG